MKSIFKKVTLVTLMFGLVFALFACKKKDAKVLENYLLKQDKTVVSEDFTLDATLNFNDKDYALTWESNNNAIELQKRESDYLAKVNRPDQETEVTLTVKVGKASKSFTVTVQPVSVYDFSGSYTFPKERQTVTDDFNLDQSCTFAGKTATITWSVDDEYKDYIEISSDGTKCIVTPTSTEPEVKIKATFSYGGETTTKQYRMIISEVKSDEERIDYWYSETGISQVISGYVVAKGNWKEYNGVYEALLCVIDDSGLCGYYLYLEPTDMNKEAFEALQIGAHVTNTGSVNAVYHGLQETSGYKGMTVLDSDIAVKTIEPFAIDNDLIGSTPVAKYMTSTLVSLTNWQVKEVKTWSVSGSTNTVLVVTKGGVDVAVVTSKYFLLEPDSLSTDTTLMPAIQASIEGIQAGDYVNIKGILSYYDAPQIVAISADAITRGAEDTTAAADLPGAKVKAVMAANKAKFPKNLVTVNSTIEFAASTDDVTVKYELLSKSNAITIENNNVTITPNKSEVATLKITYTCGTYSTYEVVKIKSQKVNDEQMVEMEKEALENFNVSYTYTLQSKGATFQDVNITWALKEASTGVSVNKGKLVTAFNLNKDVVLVATLTLNEATATKEITVHVATATVAHAGTEADPMDAKDAIAAASKLNKTTNEKTSDKFYITGTIVDDPTADYCNFNLQDGETKIVVYGLSRDAAFKERYGSRRELKDEGLPVAKNDVVVVYGGLQNYGGKLEIINAQLIKVNGEAPGTVHDTTAPVITFAEGVKESMEAAVLVAGQNVAAEFATFKDQITITDDTDGAITVTDAMINYGGFDPANMVAGTYTITITATDAAGNTGTATVTLTVVADTTGPVITISADTLAALAQADFKEGDDATEAFATLKNGVSIVDNVDGNITPADSMFDLGGLTLNNLVAGTYTITITATDAAGNVGTKTVEVGVRDITAPVITIADEVTTALNNAFLVEGQDATALFTALMAGVTVTDNVDGNIQVAQSMFDLGGLNPANLAAGTYTITITAKDAANNEATETVEVVVKAKANVNMLSDLPTTDADYTSANWKKFSYVEKATGEMYSKEKTDDSGTVKVASIANGYSQLRTYRYSTGESLGQANKISFKAANDFSTSAVIKYKVKLTTVDDQEVYALGSDTEWAEIAQGQTLAPVSATFDTIEVKTVELITYSEMSGNAYLYVGAFVLELTGDAPTQLDLLSDLGAKDSNYNSANWTRCIYKQLTSVEMRSRANAGSGMRLANMATGSSQVRYYRYTTGESLGVANMLSFKAANNYTTNAAMQAKIRVIGVDDSEVYVLGTEDTWATIPANMPLTPMSFVFDDMEVQAVEFIIYSSLASAYVYVGDLELTYESVHRLNASHMVAGDVNENLIVDDYFTVLPNGTKVKVDANKKQSGSLAFTQRLKLGGKSSTTAGAVKFTTTQPNTKVIVYAYSSSGDEEREVQVFNESGTKLAIGVGAKTGEIIPLEVVIAQPGTYFVGNLEKAINIYAIVVVDGGAPVASPAAAQVVADETAIAGSTATIYLDPESIGMNAINGAEFDVVATCATNRVLSAQFIKLSASKVQCVITLEHAPEAEEANTIELTINHKGQVHQATVGFVGNDLA